VGTTDSTQMLDSLDSMTSLASKRPFLHISHASACALLPLFYAGPPYIMTSLLPILYDFVWSCQLFFWPLSKKMKHGIAKAAAIHVS
jgi:hypothetical protein